MQQNFHTPTRTRKTVGEPLFFGFSDDEKNPTYENGETGLDDWNDLDQLLEGARDFSLDSDGYDILPATPPLTMSTFASDDEKRPSSELSLPSQNRTLPNPSFAQTEDGRWDKPKKDVELKNEDSQMEDDIDEFAELDAWFNSAAVEIVYT